MIETQDRRALLTVGAIFRLVGLDLIGGQTLLGVGAEVSGYFVYGFAMAVLHDVSTLGSAVLWRRSS